MMPFALDAALRLENFTPGDRIAVARVGDDGTAELALYSRDDVGWSMVGNGWGEPKTSSSRLAQDYEDMIVVSLSRDVET